MPKIIPSVEINYRSDFALLANSYEIRKIVEIGTHRGIFARQLMSRFQGQLICIDPYLPFHRKAGGREADILQAVMAVQEWADRVQFVRASSPDILDDFPEWLSCYPPIRLVYIDGDHSYAGVANDISAWWKFLPADGILAGHDYDPGHSGVMQAVNEFAEHSGKTVRIVSGDKDSPPSWYVYKNEPTGLRRGIFNP